MPYNDLTTGDHVTLLINQLGLPDDEQQRDAFLEDLETAVEAVLADHGLEADHLRTFDGHTYASIDNYCPLCGDVLKLIEPRIDYTDGASARATCECGWRGRAIYRLIDLHELQPPLDKEEMTDSEYAEALFADSSSVRLHDIRPVYTPY